MGIFLLVGQSLSLSAQLRPGAQGENDGPIAISSDHLVSDENNSLVTFSGSVVARQGGMTITCDVMKVYYLDDGSESAEPQEASSSPFSTSGRRIDRVECEGNVKVVESGRMAVGEKGLYLAQALPRRIVLTGNARVWQGRDSLTGHQVTYYLDGKRSVVESRQRQRVRAVYHQE